MRSSGAHKQRGFTLIELLVVIAIIVVLIGLILPAIQKVREAANRLVCANNQKQMAVAVHHYHEVHEKLPSGYSFGGNGKKISTLHVLLLPFVEQDNLYKDMRTTFTGPRLIQYIGYRYFNRKALRKVVETYYCPSDALPNPPVYVSTALETSSDKQFYNIGGTTNVTSIPPGEQEETDRRAHPGLNRFFMDFGMTSYGGNAGTRSQSSMTLAVGANNNSSNSSNYQSRDGLFFDDTIDSADISMVTDIPDGSSNTILFGERYHRDDNFDRVWKDRDYGPEWWNQGTYEIKIFGWWGCPSSLDVVLSSYAPINYRYPENPSPSPTYSTIATDKDADGEYEQQDEEATATDNAAKRVQCFGSGHPGGANFIFADGSLRFLTDETPLSVLQALTTRAGGEILPSGY